MLRQQLVSSLLSNKKAGDVLGVAVQLVERILDIGQESTDLAILLAQYSDVEGLLQ